MSPRASCRAVSPAGDQPLALSLGAAGSGRPPRPQSALSRNAAEMFPGPSGAVFPGARLQQGEAARTDFPLCEGTLWKEGGGHVDWSPGSRPSLPTILRVMVSEAVSSCCPRAAGPPPRQQSQAAPRLGLASRRRAHCVRWGRPRRERQLHAHGHAAAVVVIVHGALLLCPEACKDDLI